MADTLITDHLPELGTSTFGHLDLGPSLLAGNGHSKTETQSDAFFRLSVLSVGTFVVRAADEEQAWQSLTQHGEQHPSLKIGRPLEMLPGMAISVVMDDRESITARTVSINNEPYVRAVQFFEPTHNHSAKPTLQKSTTSDSQGTLPLVYPFRNY